jgi:hypothetical protein
MRWLIAIAFAYLYFFPYFPKINSANELPRAYLVKAIADEHTFAIDGGIRQYRIETADMSPYGGHKYSNKAPGSSMLAVPPYVAVRVVAGEPSLTTTIWIARVFTGVIPMLAFLWLLYGFLERFTPDPTVRKLTLVAYALGSMAMTYSILFYSHQLGAVCIGSAWILATDVAERRRGLTAMAAAGALAGAAPLVDYQAAFAGVPVGAYVIAKMWSWPRRELLRAVGVAAAGAAVPLAVMFAYHAVCFGSPFRTGYEASTTFAHFHQEGFLGMTRPRWEAFWGSFFRIDNGLFVLAPWVLLAIPGGIALARKGQRPLVWMSAAVAVIYILFISSINFWRGGWGVGPRYVTAMLPFLLPLVASSLDGWRARPWHFAGAGGLVLVGIVVYTMSTATFPYWPDSMKHPMYDASVHLLADGLTAPNAGTWLGLPWWLALVPYLAVAGGLTYVLLAGVGGRRAALIATAFAVALVSAYGLHPDRGKDVTGASVDVRYSRVRAAVEERR